MGKTYKESGVDIQAGDNTIEQIKPFIKSTHNERVLSDIGLFGGFYDAKFDDIEHPVLVASTDGVGTKLKIAFAMNKHHTIGQCLVNHCVNDILCCGAKPLFFLDYFATGKLQSTIASEVIKGFALACKENSCALIGGETAEMPSIYNEGEYDVSGTIVGIVEKSNIVNGSNIKKGDILIGLASNGLHTNGYSLARAAIESKYKYTDYINELDSSIGETLLNIHTSYLNPVYNLAQNHKLSGISHITGGGIVGNTKRIIPDGLSLNIEWDSWDEPVIFDIIRKAGNIEEEEMRHVFNLGIGMLLVCAENNVDEVLKATSKFNSKKIGHIN